MIVIPGTITVVSWGLPAKRHLLWFLLKVCFDAAPSLWTVFFFTACDWTTNETSLSEVVPEKNAFRISRAGTESWIIPYRGRAFFLSSVLTLIWEDFSAFCHILLWWTVVLMASTSSLEWFRSIWFAFCGKECCNFSLIWQASFFLEGNAFFLCPFPFVFKAHQSFLVKISAIVL